jgi:hypothetical protein
MPTHGIRRRGPFARSRETQISPTPPERKFFKPILTTLVIPLKDGALNFAIRVESNANHTRLRGFCRFVLRVANCRR